jgi:tetratricopeptide (TPR) repeat protein
MSAPFSRTRRFALSLVTLLVAAALFRPQIAQALIVRGDEYLYRGDLRGALVRYKRALHVSPTSGTAADRFIFLSMQQNTAKSLQDGVTEATRFLSLRGGDATVRFDRALCYLHQKHYSAAQADFEIVAPAVGAQADVFAGWAAEHARRHRDARRLWTRALLASPHYRPAQIALAEHP